VLRVLTLFIVYSLYCNLCTILARCHVSNLKYGQVLQSIPSSTVDHIIRPHDAMALPVISYHYQPQPELRFSIQPIKRYDLIPYLLTVTFTLLLKNDKNKLAGFKVKSQLSSHVHILFDRTGM